MANRCENNGKSERLYFWGAPKSLKMMTAAMKLKDAGPWKKSYNQPRQHIEKQRHLLTKVRLVKAMVFPESCIMGELDYNESWALKKWCFWTVVLEKTLESLLDFKEIELVSPKWNQSWIFIERTDAETEVPIVWPPDAKNWLIWKVHCWEWLKAGEGDDRGWDGWMASLTQWMWVWVNTGSWWWTGRPGVPQFMGSQRLGPDCATELRE